MATKGDDEKRGDSVAWESSIPLSVSFIVNGVLESYIFQFQLPERMRKRYILKKLSSGF